MKTGDEVVCVDDIFDGWAVIMYDSLPIKGFTYTVRDVSMGRTDPKNTGIDSMEMSVTLYELKNGIDPLYTGGEKELGFKAVRFRKLEEVFEEVRETNYQHIGEFATNAG